MTQRYLAISFLLIIGLTLGGCSKFTRVMKSTDVDKKLEAAFDYYAKQDYYRAGALFEDLLPSVVGSKNAERVQFTYAYCYFYQDQYQLSAHYFKQFFDTYRRSDLAEEAFYMHAKSLYMDTPRYNLDQSNTGNAITALQDFLNRFPRSAYAPEATVYINNLQEKLEEKAYNIAKLYHRLRLHKAAVVTFNNFERDFPDSDYKEETSYLKIQSQFELAKISISNKQQERYSEAIEMYLTFLDRYPNSEYLKPAENIYVSCQKQIASIYKAKEQLKNQDY